MRKTRMVVLACCLVCLSLPGLVEAQFFNHSYAIVIGINNYEYANTWKPLSNAEKDAGAIADFLRSQGFAVTPLYGPTATKAAIISAMEDNLAPKVEPDDRVLVFFAGHGKTETLGSQKRGYIVPYDGDNSSSLISMEELRAQSSYMGNARHQLFIMDSCYGGLLVVTQDSIVDPHLPHYLKAVTDRVARQVLTAGGEGQTVVDGGPKGHSVFVDALLEGLQDGLADLNGDGYITFHELVAYVTPRASNDYETPGDGELPGHQEGEFLFKNPKGPGHPVVEIPVPANTQQRRGAMPVGCSLFLYMHHACRTAAQSIALGNARWGVSDWDGAAAQYREAIRVDPDDAEVHFYLGVTLFYKGDFDGAVAQGREAVRLNPDYPEAHGLTGAALAQKGNWDGAITEDREAIRLKPDYPEAHENLGVALGSKKDFDAGIIEEREAIRLKPDLAAAHSTLGAWLGGKGEWDGDIREEREAIRLKPDGVEAHDFLGYALENKGDTQGALAEYRRALELNPRFADARSHYDALVKKVNSFRK